MTEEQMLHISDDAGFQLCDSTVAWDGKVYENPNGHVLGLCVDCASKAAEQHGVPFGEGYITDEQRAELDAEKVPWDEHTEDCCPGELVNFGAAIEQDEQFVKDVYTWFQTSLVEMAGQTGWDPAVIVRVIRFISATAMYFYTGECFMCGDTVNEVINENYKRNLARMAEANGGSTVRSEGGEPQSGT